MTTFGELCCEVCGVPGSVEPMYRANEKGVKGIWRCVDHLEQAPDPVTMDIVETIAYPGLHAGDLSPMTPEQIEQVRASREES